MSASKLITKIKEDLESIFGDLAPHLVNKRLDDLGISHSDSVDISFREVEMIIRLLRDFTFPLFLNKKTSIEKTRTYMRWLNAERAGVSG